MLYTINGTITHKNHNKIIVQLAGIGFEIYYTHTKTAIINQNVCLYTYLHWSAEQGPSLYGFETLLDKEVFLLIIDCSGIGPKLGMSILEQISTMDFLQIIFEENTEKMSTLKGVGTKKAEQLILSLKNKTQKFLNNQLIEQPTIKAWTELQQTLASLNYSPIEIKQTTAILKEQLGNQTIAIDLLLRKALTLLAK